MELLDFTLKADYMLLGAVNAVKKDIAPRKSIQEQDYLTAIVTKFPLLMNSTWDEVKYGGCFIHKSPLVSFKKGGRCEAGDLLVLCREIVEKDVRYNAALFQLKRVLQKNAPFIKPDNMLQYKFYSEWPEFSIGGKFYPALSRNIEPKAVTPGAQYMLINDPDFMTHHLLLGECCYHHQFVFTHSIPRPEMYSTKDLTFGRFLWDFTHWQNGRPIAPEEDARGDEWSRFIWDLIVKTHNVVIRNVNAGLGAGSKQSKQQGDFFDILTTKECISYLPKSYLDGLTSDHDGGDNKEEVVNEEDNGAISILFVDIS